jgi:hypothetical protein
MKSHRILTAALLLCSFAACGTNPTSSDPQAQPAGASFDGGGYTIGSGGYTQEPDSTTMQDTGGFGIGSGYTQGESEENTDERTGGFGIGSGI